MVREIGPNHSGYLGAGMWRHKGLRCLSDSAKKGRPIPKRVIGRLKVENPLHCCTEPFGSQRLPTQKAVR
ncbi:hypothetical protein IQ25_01527 [Novosphingobium taihuense]|uniref:Uncharacterized protein n=1 Tax=Novosphingobium taihuense TaxID=260085 RepID=A0A7W7ACU1_9SPHN|nr:hypothetical protein [Novosphingobium taihuense]TWH86080.1 hypothetical protein IQ25_01527 [Novosphingobium taihuense]